MLTHIPPPCTRRTHVACRAPQAQCATLVVKRTHETEPAVWVVGVDGSATADAAVESVYNYKGAADTVHVVHVRDKDDTDPARFTAFVERCEKHADAMGSKFVLLDTSPERGIAGAVLDYVRAAHAGVAMCVCCVVLCVCVCVFVCVCVCVCCVCVCVCV